MVELLEQIDRAADVYRAFVVNAAEVGDNLDRLSLFGYRTSVLESEVIKPLVLFLLDPEQPQIPDEQLVKALEAVESWMVRRMLVRATTKSYTQFIAEIITELRKGDREHAGDAIELFLAGQTSGSRYWPDDDEVREELKTLSAYRRLRRGRLRMVLEAIEDYMRGWRNGQVGFGGQRIIRGKLHIEHVMPRKWELHWPLPPGEMSEGERDRLLHTIGNLTLLTGPLNAKVSNGPWLGESGKRQGLEARDVLMLNRELLRSSGDKWTEGQIRRRSEELADMIMDIWRAPAGHRSGFAREKPSPRHRVDLLDLISAGSIQAGSPLHPRGKRHGDVTAVLLPDGRLDIGGNIYTSPSEAGKAIRGRPTNGWWWFLADREARRSLADVRRDYLESLAEDVEDEEPDDEGDDDA
jgi:hypothetical protein